MEYLTIDEAALRLGISIATARRWAANGRIPAVKSGKQWIVDGSGLTGKRRPPRSSTRLTDDLDQALRYVRHTDLAETPVPDVLRHADELENEAAILAAARSRLEGAGPGVAIEIDVDKTPFFTRRMTGLHLEDRIAYQAAVASFADRVESRTSPSVYSARLSEDPRYFFKKGTTEWAKWRKGTLGKLVPGHEWLVSTDLTSYFDTISHRLLLADVEALGADRHVVSALREMLREWSGTEGTGLPQGPNASRLLGNLFLLPVDEAMLSADWEYSRYLDDIRIVTETRADAVRALRQLHRECQTRGLIISSSKTELLHGEKAKDSLVGSLRLSNVEYLLKSQVPDLAREELKSILEQALNPEVAIDVRNAKFSLWRLTQLREPDVLPLVLARLEDLAPVATVVAAYLQPFIAEKAVITGVASFLRDPSRSYSQYLCTWLFAAMLEHPGPQPQAWTDQALKRVKDRNQPDYLRAVAAAVVGRGRRTGDISWMRKEISREHNPVVLRGFAVALFWAGRLDGPTGKRLASGRPHLKRTVDYLKGRTRLPSLVSTRRWLYLGDDLDT
jgi:excisionase family DNA binding protein